MCRSCGHLRGPADDASHGDRSPFPFAVSPAVRWAILGVALLAAAPWTIGVLKSGSAEPTRTDRVFAADLSRQAVQAARISRAMRVLARAAGLRHLAESIGRIERAHAELGRLRGAEARAGPVGASADGRSFLSVAARHARDDQVLARIELAGGRDPDLRARARDLERDGRRMLAELVKVEQKLARRQRARDRILRPG
jgi:hypothetical protein